MCRRVTSFGRNTQEENSQSTTYTAISNNNDLETPATAIIVKNVETKTGNDKDGIVEITSSMTKMTYKNHGVLKQIKKMVRNEDDVSSSSESKLDEESSDSSEKNDTDHIVEIDEADFQTLLMESMALQVSRMMFTNNKIGVIWWSSVYFSETRVWNEMRFRFMSEYTNVDLIR